MAQETRRRPKSPGTSTPDLSPEAKTRIVQRIPSVGALYAHALAIEREAVKRYRDFAALMSDRGDDRLAEVFNRLEKFEQGHVAALTAKIGKTQLPEITPGEYAWLDAGAPLPEARAFVFRMSTPREALEIALLAERRAKAFFESVLKATADPDICRLAREFAAEEAIHIEIVKYALDRLPVPFQPSEEHPEDPGVTTEL